MPAVTPGAALGERCRRSQVITPPTFFQPWLVSSEVALAMENAYGPWPPFSFCTDGTHWLFGWVGTPPEVG